MKIRYGGGDIDQQLNSMYTVIVQYLHLVLRTQAGWFLTA